MNEVSIAPGVLAVLADSAVKSAAVLLLAWAVTRVMRQASAAARHVVWLAALGGSLLLPMASTLLPAYRLAVLPPARVEPVRSVAIASPPIASVPPVMPKLIDSSLDDKSIIPLPRPQLLPLVGHELPAPLLSVPQTPALLSAAPTHSSVAPAKLLLGAWAIGTVALLLMWGFGLLVAWRLTRRCTVVTHGAVFDVMQSTRRELGRGREVRLRVGEVVTMPLASGLLRHSILLPTTATAWPSAQLRSVLLHELAHVKRRDCATQWLAHLATAMYWFNPLAWLAAARLRVERERACDDLVLSQGALPATYAEHLVTIAALLNGRSRPPLAAIGMARPAGLRRRVCDVLDGRINRRSLSARFMFTAAVTTTAILVPLAAVHLQGRPIEAKPASAPTSAPPAVPRAQPAPLSVNEEPRLRFLTWQGGDKPSVGPLPRAWLANGLPLTESDLSFIPLVEPAREDVSAAKLPPLDVLYLWFSHPGFDSQTFVGIDVTDASGKSLLIPFGPVDAMTMPADAMRQNVGWVTAAPCVAISGGRPVEATIRLQYSAEPWHAGTSFPSDYNGSISFGNAVILSGFGQDKDGHAFVGIAYNAEARDTQYGFTVHTRDGRDLPCALKRSSGTAGFFTQQFTADVPLSAVASFTSRSRRVRTVVYRNVSLAPLHMTSVRIGAGDSIALQPATTRSIETSGRSVTIAPEPMLAPVPQNRFALRVLCPAGTPIAIDAISVLQVWIKEGPWQRGPIPLVLGRTADGWVYVDAQMLLLGKPRARVAITYQSGGNTMYAESVYPAADRRIEFQSMASPEEVGLDYGRGPAASAKEIVGRVVDPQGRPVAHATVVTPLPAVYPMKMKDLSVSVTTDSDGIFRLPDSPHRNLFYELRASGYATRWLTGLTAGTPVTVHLFNDTRLRGKLLLPDGSPAAGATLEISASKYAAKVPWIAFEGLTVETLADAVGAYDVPLEPGVYDVRITSPGGAVARHTEMALWSGATMSLPSQLQAAATLALRSIDSLSGKPVVGAHYVLQKTQQGYVWNIVGTERTSDARGDVRWDGLVPGPTDIAVNAKGFGSWWIEPHDRLSWNTADNPGPDSLRVDVHPQGSELTVKLRPAAAVEGVVLSPDGKPMAHAIVDVAYLRTGDSRYFKQTDAQGKFTLTFEGRPHSSTATSQPSNRYAIVAYDPARQWANGLSEMFEALPGKTQTMTVRMQVGGRVQGRVIDRARKPVAHIEIEAVASDGGDREYYDPRTLTDSAGRFDLGPMRPATYTVYADAFFGVNIDPRATPYPQPIAIDQSETDDLGDVSYTGPAPGPVPADYKLFFPDGLAARPATVTKEPTATHGQDTRTARPAGANGTTLVKPSGDDAIKPVAIKEPATPKAQAELPEPAIALTEVPPVVVNTSPIAGTDGIDPATNEIRVTFSKPMAGGSWSWVQASSNSFPEIRGKPHYSADHRTCRLPVKLKPNHAYTHWLNADEFQNFIDEAHQPAVPYLLVFNTRAAASTRPSHS